MLKYRFLGLCLLVSSLSFFSCSSQEPMTDEYSQLPDKLLDITAAEIRSSTEFQASSSYFNFDVSVHKITYPVKFKGKSITCSGVIALPKDLDSPPILIDNHGTLQRNVWAPSFAIEDEFIYRFTEFASAGYIVLAPDFIGFGESAEQFHPWLLPDPGADAVIGIIEAGKNFLNEFGVSYDDRVFLTGFSEGANIALGAQRKIEQDGLQGIHLVASSPCSGAYDMDYTFTNRILGNTPTEAVGGAYMIITLRAYYDWNDPLTTFFKEPYGFELQKILDMEGTFVDNFFTENRVSIDYATGILNHELLYNESFLDDFANNPNNKVKQKLIENNIHMWKPSVPTMLQYGKNDTTTYFQNSLNTYQEFLNRGADPNTVTIVGYEGKDHEGSENPWMKATLDWFSELK